MNARANVLLGMITTLSAALPSSAIVIPLTNASFEDTSLPADNQFDFVNPYNGWTELDSLNGGVVAGGNLGPINVSPSDIPAEAFDGQNALYFQNDNVVVIQTTGHIIGAGQDVTVSIKTGNDNASQFGGYILQLYAEDINTGVRTAFAGISSNSDGNNPADGSWNTQGFTIDIDNYQGTYGVYGKKLGIMLEIENDDFPVFYDLAELSYVPEPALGMVALGGIAMLRRRR